ncbi:MULTISPECIES: hypothetical protein [Nisaea]|uniref:hypothetical protein n=1 Tax=Nisaea TaxID=390876 RepID=UPI0012ECAC1C|nr:MULTISPECIES: hypothetical protein [Nisaea]
MILKSVMSFILLVFVFFYHSSVAASEREFLGAPASSYLDDLENVEMGNIVKMFRHQTNNGAEFSDFVKKHKIAKLSKNRIVVKFSPRSSSESERGSIIRSYIEDFSFVIGSPYKGVRGPELVIENTEGDGDINYVFSGENNFHRFMNLMKKMNIEMPEDVKFGDSCAFLMSSGGSEVLSEVAVMYFGELNRKNFLDCTKILTFDGFFLSSNRTFKNVSLLSLPFKHYLGGPEVLLLRMLFDPRISSDIAANRTDPELAEIAQDALDWMKACFSQGKCEN